MYDLKIYKDHFIVNMSLRVALVLWYPIKHLRILYALVLDADEVHYIKKAMDKWEETTCLKFRPYRSSDRNRIRFQNGNGYVKGNSTKKDVLPVTHNFNL